PLRALESFATNLPLQTTSFVGRERELAEVKALLTETRLLTVTGIGGVGKTRLALQVGADLLDEFRDGVWLVELAGLSDAGLVGQAVASALGVREEPNRGLLETLLDHLRSKRLLLILDNAEHLLEACAELADALLQTCGDVQLLTTSREALGIAGEATWQVPSLPAPDAERLQSLGAGLPAALTQYDAVQLFIERAAAAKSGFAVTNENAPAVAQICWRLDGIPLGIELAAARTKALTAEQIAERLDDRFRLLTGGSRTALPRQRTLRAAIDWSYELLSKKERGLLRRLSVFAGGWTLEAAEAVAADQEGADSAAGGRLIEEHEVLDLLSQLVEKSLSVAEEETGEMRYHLLETVRQYGAEKLRGMREDLVTHRRHRDWFLSLAEGMAAELRGPEQNLWLGRLEREHDNLRAALEWCKCEGDGVEAGLCLAASLSRFWHIRGYWTEGRSHLEDTLALECDAGGDGETRKAARARALNGAGFLAFRQGDYAAARAFHEESMEIRRELGDRRGVGTSLNNLGLVAADQGDYEAARAMYEESLAINREEGSKVWEAITLNNLGIVAERQTDYARARELFEQSLAIRRELGEKTGIAGSLNNLAVVARHEGDYAGARALLEESLEIKRELGDRRGVAGSLTNLGIVAERQGDYAAAQALLEESLETKRNLGDKVGVASSLLNLGVVARSRGDGGRARELFEESLAIRRELGEAPGIAECLEELGGISGAQGEPEVAARLLGASEALREAIKAPVPPDDREEYDSDVATVRAAMDEAAFAAAWSEGRAMTMEEAIAYALAEAGDK
ncbi:MAG: tetratricopeptide repeat protein, partial [Armatimonadota bacterium]